jgi:hypothetical protein
VGLDEMLQRKLERGGVAQIAVVTRGDDVFHDHAPDALLAFRCVHEIVAHLDGGHFRNVLVLGDGENLVFGEFGQFDAVLDCKHECLR